MRAGELDKIITIQYAAKSKNSFGENIETWATLAANVWANVEFTTGNERFLQQERIAETTAVFKIRLRTDINSTRRIKYGNRYFNILSVFPSKEDSQKLVIMAKEVI
jgi:SPP1 family predicted phage head-tail adaptor